MRHLASAHEQDGAMEQESTAELEGRGRPTCSGRRSRYRRGWSLSATAWVPYRRAVSTAAPAGPLAARADPALTVA